MGTVHDINTGEILVPELPIPEEENYVRACVDYIVQANSRKQIKNIVFIVELYNDDMLKTMSSCATVGDDAYMKMSILLGSDYKAYDLTEDLLGDDDIGE